jgi:hypothetical protein
MSKEKVFIIVSHKNIPKKGSHPGRHSKPTEWEVQETVEFVNQVRNRHTSTASAIGDYINRKMIIGERYGMGDYDKFEEYVRTKYNEQMGKLDEAYRADRTPVEDSPEVMVDQFGNVRTKTVFDVA